MAEEAGSAPKAQHNMRVLLPALAIGIFLSALDQTLIVATYARISSDLQALNRTSWISAAWELLQAAEVLEDPVI